MISACAGEQDRPLQRVDGLADRAPDHAGGSFPVTWRKAKQRQAGLRLTAEAACLAVRSLGRLEVSPQTMELTLLVDRLPRRRPVHRLLAALAGEPRLFESVLPIALELHDPRPMREAAAGEGDHLRLAVAPAGERARPLLRAARARTPPRTSQ